MRPASEIIDQLLTSFDLCFKILVDMDLGLNESHDPVWNNCNSIVYSNIISLVMWHKSLSLIYFFINKILI